LVSPTLDARFGIAKSGPVRTAFVFMLIASLMASTLTILGSSARVSAQDVTDSIAAFVPETSLLYADFELDQSSAQWTLATELVERSGVPDLLSTEDREETDQGLQELGQTFDGQGALVLTRFPVDAATIENLTDSAAGVATDPAALMEGDVPEGWAAIFQPSDAEALYDAVLDMSSQDADAETEEIEYNGYTIVVLNPADEFSTGTAVALVDDIVAVATVPEDIEPIIDTVNGDTAPLANNENFTNLRGRFEAEVLAFGYVNGPSILAEVEALDSDALSQVPEEFIASLNAFSGFAFWADEPGFRLDILAVPAEGTELPEAETLDPSFASQVPADSLVYAGGMNLGENAGLQYLALIFAQETVGVEPGATPVATQSPEDYANEVFAQAESVVGFNIKTDFLDQMQGEWGFGLTVQNVTESSADIDAVFVSETADAATVTDVTDKITAIVSSEGDESFEISSREVAGSSVTVIDLSESGFPFVLEYGVVNDQFLVGINGGIDDFVNGPDEPLSESENFTATMGQLPETFNAISYVNLEQVLPMIDTAIAATSSSGTLVDADPACEEFETQEEAQAAFDADQFENFALDQDYDGAACEDHFAPASPEASPESAASSLNLLSFGSVSFQNDGTSGTSIILLIGE